MESSSRNPTSPLADYEDEDDTGEPDRIGIRNHPDSPDMMDVEGGDHTQFPDYTFSAEEPKERSDKAEDSLSSKARQFIAKNKHRSSDGLNACQGGIAATITSAAEDPPPSPAPTSNASQIKEKSCTEQIDFPPQFLQSELQGCGLPTPLHWVILLELGGVGSVSPGPTLGSGLTVTPVVTQQPISTVQMSTETFRRALPSACSAWPVTLATLTRTVLGLAFQLFWCCLTRPSLPFSLPWTATVWS